MIKRFLDWFRVKEKIDRNPRQIPLYKEGDVWWCSIGENVGVEISGKGEAFSRPVFVYRKLNVSGFMGIPLSTQIRTGSWFVPLYFKNKRQAVNLAQARTISTNRLLVRMGELSDSDKGKIKDGFRRLYL